MTDKTTIVLNEDESAVALRHILDVQHALATIAAGVEKSFPLNNELAYNALRVAEWRLKDVCKTLGVETEGAKEVEERNLKLRQANYRVRELETQLGDLQAPELTQTSLKNLSDHLDKWWKFEGFGHVADTKFGPYAAEITFSCRLSGFNYSGSQTPVSDKSRKRTWCDSLRERGFVLTDDDGDQALKDCDSNRQLLVELLESRLPSCAIRSFENIRRRDSGFLLHGVTVYIRKIAEIRNLPIEEQSED